MVQHVKAQEGVTTLNFDQCAFGLCSIESGTLHKKQTTLMTNAPGIVELFSAKQCSKDHPHARVWGQEGGMRRSAAAAHYPAAMCEALAAGFLR